MVSIKSIQDLIDHSEKLKPRTFTCAFLELVRIMEAHKSKPYLSDHDGYVIAVTEDTTDMDSRGLFDEEWVKIEWEGGDYDYERECFVMVKTAEPGDLPITVIVEDAPWVEEILPGLITNLHKYTEV